MQDIPIKKDRERKKPKTAGSFMRFTLSKGMSKIDNVSNTQNLAGSNVSSLFARETICIEQ